MMLLDCTGVRYTALTKLLRYVWKAPEQNYVHHRNGKLVNSRTGISWSHLLYRLQEYTNSFTWACGKSMTTSLDITGLATDSSAKGWKINNDMLSGRTPTAKSLSGLGLPSK